MNKAMFQKIGCVVILLMSMCVPAHSRQRVKINDKYAFTMYYTAMTKNRLGHVLTNQIEIDPENLYSAEATYIFQPDSLMHRIFGRIVDRVDGNFNFTYHEYDGKSSYEYIPFLAFRWNQFPWNHYLRTDLCVGEGVSWISRVPRRERRNSDDVQNILNYLMFEVGFALPSHPDLEVLGRIHHRSGVFGLYGAKNSGSTAVGGGLRWLFR